MSLLYSVALFAASAVIGRVFYVGNRLPRTPWWAGSVITSCFNLILTAMTATGIALMLETVLIWEILVIAAADVVMMVLMTAIAAVLWVLIGRALPEADEVTVMHRPQGAAVSPHGAGYHPAPSEAPPAPTRKAA